MGRWGEGPGGAAALSVQELALPRVPLGLEELELGEGQRLGKTPSKFFGNF